MPARRRPRGVWAAAAVVCCAAGCAVKAPGEATPPGGFETGQVANWQLSGRLALSNGRDGGSGQLNWRQRGERAELRFHGAFGRAGWRLVTGPAESTLELASGERYRAASVEDLVRDHVGWEVPVRALSYWVRGLVAPDGRARTDHDRGGRLALIHQHQWLVRYDGYLEVDGAVLPRKITATKEGNRVRLLIKQWTIDSPG